MCAVRGRSDFQQVQYTFTHKKINNSVERLSGTNFILKGTDQRARNRSGPFCAASRLCSPILKSWRVLQNNSYQTFIQRARQQRFCIVTHFGILLSAFGYELLLRFCQFDTSQGYLGISFEMLLLYWLVGMSVGNLLTNGWCGWAQLTVCGATPEQVVLVMCKKAG